MQWRYTWPNRSISQREICRAPLYDTSRSKTDNKPPRPWPRPNSWDQNSGSRPNPNVWSRRSRLRLRLRSKLKFWSRDQFGLETRRAWSVDQGALAAERSGSLVARELPALLVLPVCPGCRRVDPVRARRPPALPTRLPPVCIYPAVPPKRPPFSFLNNSVTN